ncbi:MAG: hypothetical protein LUF86_05325, partial [Clostridiales bacterium]|nr:hypothetical protein [Clostridiales bacterium]
LDGGGGPPPLGGGGGVSGAWLSKRDSRFFIFYIFYSHSAISFFISPRYNDDNNRPVIPPGNFKEQEVVFLC